MLLSFRLSLAFQNSHVSVDDVLQRQSEDDVRGGPLFEWEVTNGVGKHSDSDLRPPIDNGGGGGGGKESYHYQKWEKMCP
jgi:hypothetical protein